MVSCFYITITFVVFVFLFFNFLINLCEALLYSVLNFLINLLEAQYYSFLKSLINSFLTVILAATKIQNIPLSLNNSTMLISNT